MDMDYSLILVGFTCIAAAREELSCELAAKIGDRVINCCTPFKFTLKKIISWLRKLLREGPRAVNVIGIFFELYPPAQKENKTMV